MPSSVGRAAAPEPVPLGSLTQRGAVPERACAACGSAGVTRIGLSLTDGSPVELISCHDCEHRSWTEHGQPLTVTRVLDKARKHR